MYLTAITSQFPSLSVGVEDEMEAKEDAEVMWRLRTGAHQFRIKRGEDNGIFCTHKFDRSTRRHSSVCENFEACRIQLSYVFFNLLVTKPDTF